MSLSAEIEKKPKDGVPAKPKDGFFRGSWAIDIDAFSIEKIMCGEGEQPEITSSVSQYIDVEFSRDFSENPPGSRSRLNVSLESTGLDQLSDDGTSVDMPSSETNEKTPLPSRLDPHVGICSVLAVPFQKRVFSEPSTAQLYPATESYEPPPTPRAKRYRTSDDKFQIDNKRQRLQMPTAAQKPQGLSESKPYNSSSKSAEDNERVRKASNEIITEANALLGSTAKHLRLDLSQLDLTVPIADLLGPPEGTSQPPRP